MKNLKIHKLTVIILFFLLGGVQSAEAQFWKKIKERVKEGVEEAILRKTEEKATQKTENAIDSVFAIDKILKRKKGKNNENIALPESYDFEWEYTMQMQYKDGNINMIYFLKPHATYFGMKPEFDKKNPTGDMVIILDLSRNISISLMQINEDKIMNAMSIPDDKNDNEKNQGYTIIKTDKKIILGYTCQGFKAESEEMIVNMYVAENAPVNFVLSNNSNSKNVPKGFNPKWFKEFENGIMMEMEFKHKKKNKKKYNGKMVCISLKKNPFSINPNEYKSFMQMGDK